MIDLWNEDGERIATDVVWHDGSDPVRMHNDYPLFYNRCVFEVLEEALGERLLVVPVFAPDGTVEYYLPTGRWMDFLNGAWVEGGAGCARSTAS